MIWFAGVITAVWLLAALAEYLLALHAAASAVPVPAHANRRRRLPR